MLKFEGIEAIGGDAGHRHFGPHVAQGALNPASPSTDVMVIHRLAEHDIGVGVEAFRQLVPVVLKIRLHGISAALERIFLRLWVAAESTLEFCGRAVTHLADPSCNGETVYRARVRGVIVASGERRVLTYGADLQRAQCDLVRRRPGPHGEHHGATNPLGMAHTPLQDSHAAHRSPYDAGPRVNAEGIGQLDLHLDLVSNRDQRKLRPVRRPVRPTRGGPGRPLATAENIRAHDEIDICIDRGSWPDHPLPPAWRRMTWSGWSCRVGISRQRVQHENGVTPPLVESAPRFVGHRDFGQKTAALE